MLITELLTSTNDTVRLVSAADPSIIAANAAEALARYRNSHHIDDLDVPDGATVFSVRGLTRADRQAALLCAGRKSDKGMSLWYTQTIAAQLAGAVAMAEATKCACIAALEDIDGPGADDVKSLLANFTVKAALADDGPLSEATLKAIETEGATAFGKAYGGSIATNGEALSDADVLALARHDRWADAHNVEVCERAIVKVEPVIVGLESKGGRYPFGDLVETLNVRAARDGDLSRPGSRLLTEIADHIEAVTRLGKGGLKRSPSPSGTKLKTPQPGHATPADSASETPA